MSEYVFGFNGKEKDNEIKGEWNSYNYGNRFYDPRVGRFLSIDPITNHYPELTPYQFASNRPIEGVDQDGLEFDKLKEWIKTQPQLKNNSTGTTNNQFAGLNLGFLKLPKESYNGSSWTGLLWGKNPITTFGNNVQTSAWNQAVGTVEYGSMTLTKEGRKQQQSMMAHLVFKGIMWLAKDNDEKVEDVKRVATDVNTYENIGGTIFLGKVLGAQLNSFNSKLPSFAKAGTGTVWDDITPTQPNYPGSVLPKSFELTTTNGTKVWVHGNATEHIAEFIKSRAQYYTPDAVRLATQQQLSSLQSAVSTAIEGGIKYDQIMNVGDWELKFSAPRQQGQLPALNHAQPLK